jgi:spore coat-associated protein N
MKKILISLAIIGVVGAIGIGATVAYFTDTETSTGNTFTAGSLDLTINTPKDAVWTMSDMAPGDIASGILNMTNVGSLKGDLWPSVAFVNADNSLFADTATANDVARNLIVTNAVWIDSNSHPTPGLDILSFLPDVNTNGLRDLQDLQTVFAAATDQLATLKPSETASLNMTIQFNPLVGNAYQGQGATMTMTIDMHQDGQ